MGPVGSDIALVELAQKAYHLAQWRTRVDTGRLAFPLADNPRNVDDQQIDWSQRPRFEVEVDSRKAVDEEDHWAFLEL